MEPARRRRDGRSHGRCGVSVPEAACARWRLACDTALALTATPVCSWRAARSEESFVTLCVCYAPELLRMSAHQSLASCRIHSTRYPRNEYFPQDFCILWYGIPVLIYCGPQFDYSPHPRGRARIPVTSNDWQHWSLEHWSLVSVPSHSLTLVSLGTRSRPGPLHLSFLPL